MSQKGTRANVLPPVSFLVALTLIYLFDRGTHLDVVSAVGTIVLCSIMIARWFWRGRYR